MIYDVIVVGAGLSGLTTAYRLRQRDKNMKIKILEASDRIGGRIYSQEDGLDLGGAWCWPENTSVVKLARELSVKSFPQRDAMAKEVRFEGGMIAVCQKLLTRLQTSLSSGSGEEKESEIIETNSPVIKISQSQECVEIKVRDGDIYKSRYAVVAIPPRICSKKIEFCDPPLPKSQESLMKSCPTWMGHMSKILIKYSSPFWRTQEAPLPHLRIPRGGPIAQLYDSSSMDDSVIALCAFATVPAKQELDEAAVLQQLQRMFGDVAMNYDVLTCHKWVDEEYICDDPSSPVYDHPKPTPKMYKRLKNVHFSGTETDTTYGGYLEGAILSAERVVREICEDKDKS